MKRQSRNLALAGVFSALGALMLCFGGILPLSTYACPILASLAVAVANEECSARWGWSCYAVVAVLALLLSPDKEAALMFAFLGYYPLCKPRLDALRPRAICLTAKLLLCAASVGAMYALVIFVFRLEAVVTELRETVPALLAATALLGFVTFFVYDLALARLTTLYRVRRKNAKR